MVKGGLFAKEEGVLERGKELLGSDDSNLKDAFQALLKDYEKLFKQSRRLVRLSDRQQLRLNSLNESLELRNRFITGVFGRYLSDDIVEELLQTPGGLQLGGEKRTMTILMSDLRGFTSLAERLQADQVLQILNNYLETMTDIIFQHQGTIDEILGDGLLIVFGAPICREDDADRAVACALDMQRAMQEINSWNLEQGFPELTLGIGLNTGEMIVGNIGSTRRTKYGVVGKEVNLTSRIESYTVGGQVLISESTYASCRSPLEIGGKLEVQPKGCSSSIQIFDVRGMHLPDRSLVLDFKAEPFKSLDPPVEIEFQILSGKDVVAKLKQATITGWHEKGLILSTDFELESFTNLKLTHQDLEVYVKTAQVLDDQGGSYEMAFTSLPQDSRKFLESCGISICT